MPDINYRERLDDIGAAFAANNLVLYSRLWDEFASDYAVPDPDSGDELSGGERELFEYVSGYDDFYTEGYAAEYVAPQPGVETSDYPINPNDPGNAELFAYVGVYVNSEGDFSGETPATPPETEPLDGQIINGPLVLDDFSEPLMVLDADGNMVIISTAEVPVPSAPILTSSEATRFNNISPITNPQSAELPTAPTFKDNCK